MGFCGGLNLAPGTADRSLAALRRSARGPSATIATECALAACEDAIAAQDSRAILGFDGRLDNRDALLNRLGLAAATDTGALLLAAYHRWGRDCFTHLIGDYACAIWDRDARTFYLATDPGALRTLFFWTDRGRLLFATEQRGLFACPDVPREIDRDQMAAWLCMLPREPLRTFFRGVNRVPPGHVVRWVAGEATLERWWRPEELPVIHLPCDEDYEEALREALDEAVRARIGPGERIGSNLSGGLDSSSVTALAARQLASQGRELTAFTAAPRHPQPAIRNRFTDEWPYAAEVATLYPNITHVRIDNDAEPLLDALDLREAGNDWPVLNASNNVWINGIFREAKRRRLDVVLQGAMGNMTISHNGGERLAGHLRRGDLLGALRTVRDLRRGGGRSWLGIAGQAADSLLPTRFSRSLRAAVGRGTPGLFDYSAIHPAFLHRSGMEGRAMDMACKLGNLARGDSRALRLAVLDRTDHRGHTVMSTRRLFGIDVRDPTSDRRVIELCLSIPDEQFARGGVPRSLIRRTMRGLLPDMVLDERRKGLQAADWRVGFQAALPGLRAEVARLRNSPFASECLDLDRMDQLLDAWPGAEDAGERATYDYLCTFSRALTAGRFIRRVEGGNG
ncbi:asparagine synthetase B family protein [Ancylobacter rudongensis]|uniref:asparagine synthase (glutamine-hydrolyzing) n=1 Tax=Ancylobacter rudongensis TaxID=177413 RepID=A0A1G4QKY1_9HYPH|nr:asparagine synthase-related protein [Ancylobacter rudongensis]SCW45293.1 asparagine synthase (glutamine-hydrolysing) [Ancylobacter rudongensis]